MTEHFNKLTPAEAERLAWLIEECGEVIQAAGKILRHGYDSHDPTNPEHAGNRADLERELIDLYKAVWLMQGKNDIRQPIHLFATTDTVKYRYMHHQKDDQ